MTGPRKPVATIAELSASAAQRFAAEQAKQPTAPAAREPSRARPRKSPLRRTLKETRP